MESSATCVSGEMLDELWTLRERFIATRAIWIPGAYMAELCRGLGATEEDFESIRTVSDTLKTDPTLPFRHSKNGRFIYDFDHEQVRRLAFQPFVLSVEENFVRHDSGTTREFEEVGEDLQQNSVLHALFLFQAFMFHKVEHKHRPKLDYNNNKWICTLFNLRTVTQRDILGEPALEGVHSDGVDITMTTLLGHTNMTSDSAVTFLHTLDEVNGTRWNATNPKYLLGQVQHKHFLDTLLLFDHERKHSLSPVWAVDESKPALRDMLIFFTRKPVIKGHPTHPYDSLNDHEGMPMKLNMKRIDGQEV
ncbi:MAG: hypothetical protein M1839_008686 [Geoglossum umbratile]|nr:MAG: hypothetical protein M1839_008686 [Geoglossum umbratile]